MKTVRRHGEEVREQLALHQFGMEFRYAIDRMTSDDRQIGHTHVLFAVFINDRHARDFSLITRKLEANLVEKTAIDFVDDLEMARQDGSKQRQRPFFQGLR